MKRLQRLMAWTLVVGMMLTFTPMAQMEEKNLNPNVEDEAAETYDERVPEMDMPVQDDADALPLDDAGVPDGSGVIDTGSSEPVPEMGDMDLSDILSGEFVEAVAPADEPVESGTGGAKGQDKAPEELEEALDAEDGYANLEEAFPRDPEDAQQGSEGADEEGSASEDAVAVEPDEEGVDGQGSASEDAVAVEPDEEGVDGQEPADEADGPSADSPEAHEADEAGEAQEQGDGEPAETDDGETADGDVDLGSCMTEALSPDSESVKIESNAAAVLINEKVFPDAIFRKYVKAYDFDKNGKLSSEEIDCIEVVSIDRNIKKLTSLKGIEHLSALRELDCSFSSITKLDLRSNRRLETLHCANTALTSLDLSNNPLLKTLTCENSALTSLDLRANPEMTDIWCPDAKLTEILFGECAQLRELNCARNALVDLDLSGAVSLSSLDCSENDLQRLALAGSPNLRYLECYGNHLDALDIRTQPLLNWLMRKSEPSTYITTAYDDPNTFLRITCYGMTVGDILNQMDMSLRYDKGMSLTADAAAGDADGVAIDESSFPDAAFRKIIAKWYDCDGDGVLSRPELLAVDNMDIKKKGIKDLTGIQYFENLKELDCSRNDFPVLDLSGLKRLQTLHCENCNTKRLILDGCTALEELYCRKNPLTGLDLSDLPMLGGLDCAACGLKTLDVSHCPDLRVLECNSNKLKALKLNKNTKLCVLICQNNALTKLELGNCPLRWLASRASNYECNGKRSIIEVYGPDGLETISLTCDTSVKIGLGRSYLRQVRGDGRKSVSVNIKDSVLLYYMNGSSVRNGGIPWSKNSRVVEVAPESGMNAMLLHCKAAGKATIDVNFDPYRFHIDINVIDNTIPTSVKLNTTKAVAYLGSPAPSLKATMKPGTAVSGLKWTSSNTKVAKVNAKTGKLTLVKPGTAMITVKTARGGKTARCKLIVRNPNHPKGIALDHTKKTFFAGTDAQLALTPTLTWWREDLATAKRETVTWISSNTKVAKVDANGVVTPFRAGKATITAKTVNGKTATCVVKVTRNKLDNIHAAPTKKQIRRLAKDGAVGWLKSIEIVSSRQIITEWYLMNGGSKTLKKAPSMSLYVRVSPEDEDSGDDVWLCAASYSGQPVSVPALGYSVVKISLTSKTAEEGRFMTNLKLSGVQDRLQWEFVRAEPLP